MKGKWLLTLVFVLALSGGTAAMANSGGAAKSNGNSQSTASMAGMDMGGGPVKETPANIKILGTYGAVNLSFILIGIWSKWFRRKDGSNGYSK